MDWQPIDAAPKDRGCLIGWVEGTVRLICWGKTSHVPLYGWNLADQGPEDFDLCHPTHWMPLPAAPDSPSAPEAQGEPVPVPAAFDVQRVLGYLRTDEAEIRATKGSLVWANTMARASDLIRILDAALSSHGDKGGSNG